MKKNLIFLLVILATAFSFKNTNGGLKVGSIAPEFALKDINGKTVKLSDFKGKMVLIDFCASWCKQCRIEGPKFVKIYQKFHTANFVDANGFEIISISLDNNIEDWKSAVAEDGYIWTNVSEGKKWDAEIAKLYMVTTLPTNYLLDKDGKIIEKDLRGNTLESLLQSIKK